MTARHSRPQKSAPARFIGDAVLNVAAIGGLVCIVLVALAFTLNITLIMFKTGSMAPTIPAGSTALVQKVAASTIEVGDVVTVDRDDKLPVTHRVTSIEPATSGPSRTFTMRGDANDADDAHPYTATSVRIVRGHLPGLASVIVWFSNPAVLGAITLAAAGLVTWAFWPRNNDADEAHIGEKNGTSDPPSPSDSRPARGAGSATRVVALIAGISAASLAGAEQAHAAETETHISSTVLSLTSIRDIAAMSNLTPGVPVTWQVGVSADPPEPGTVTLSLSGSGDTANAQKLTVGVESCTVRWVADTCGTGHQELVAPQLLADALEPGGPEGTRSLTTMPADEERWLRIAVTLTEAAAPSFSETLQVHARGFGDDVSTDGEPGRLPSTGSNLLAPLLLAVTAVLTGVALARRAAFRRGVR